MFFETIFAQFGNFVPGIGLSSDELFFGLNIINAFQRFQMAGEIPVGNFEQIFHGIETGRFVHRQYRHDSQADTAVENLIQMGYNTRHFFFLSYLRYIIKP